MELVRNDSPYIVTIDSSRKPQKALRRNVTNSTRKAMKLVFNVEWELIRAHRYSFLLFDILLWWYLPLFWDILLLLTRCKIINVNNISSCYQCNIVKSYYLLRQVFAQWPSKSHTTKKFRKTSATKCTECSVIQKTSNRKISIKYPKIDSNQKPHALWIRVNLREPISSVME